MRFVDLPSFGGPEVMTIGTARFLFRARARSWSASRRPASTAPMSRSARATIRRRKDASPILGLEVAGEVVAVGPGVSGYVVGDKVCGLANGGGYAEYCAAAGRPGRCPCRRVMTR